jgi:hypothetical protein
MSLKICECEFDSQIGYIKNNNEHQIISIVEYLDNYHSNNKIKIVCKKGNELIKYESETRKNHFKHKNFKNNGMSKWHLDWQNKFDNREIQIGNRRADVICNNNVIEFQHSKISQTNIDDRSNNYKNNNYNMMWVIDCNECIDVCVYDDNNFMITFNKDTWKCYNFIGQDYIYLDHKCYIYRIKPSHVKSNTVITNNCISVKDFVANLKTNTLKWSEYIDNRGKIYLNQRGAGCGKTYESIQLLEKDARFKHKNTFIYLTKMHSAKDVIHNELKEQTINGSFSVIKKINDTMAGKQYKCTYTNQSTGNNIDIIIGTVDSFMYRIGDKNTTSSDYFKGIVESICSGYINIEQHGQIKYASTSVSMCRKCLIIIDEAQDLGSEYISAFDQIINETFCDVYIIGDELQSIWGEKNIFTYVKDDVKFKSILVKSTGKNIIKRFHNTQFINFVNTIVDFEKYELPKIEGICNNNKCKYSHDNEKCPYTIFEMNTIYSNDYDDDKVKHEIDEIIKYLKTEVDDNNYGPENFLFLFPYLKGNYLANQLESRIQIFWNDRYPKKTDYTKYVFMHKSDAGKPINLNESEGMTRMMSIHASKGNGCEVVFLLGINEHTLKIYSGDKNNLVFESLLHVAITRQKKSIYVGIPHKNKNDEILCRFGKFNIKKNTPNICATNSIKINKLCTYILTTNNVYKDIDKILKKNNCDNKITSEQNINNIDWGHHVLRFSMLMYYLNCYIIINEPTHDYLDESLDEQNNCKQFEAVLHNLTMMPVNIKTYSKYYNLLNNKNGNLKEIPILLYSNKNKSHIFNKYANMLFEIIKKIQNDLKRTEPKGACPIFCQIECAVLLYMIFIVKNGKYSQINITDIYNIMYYYDQHYLVSNIKHPKKCICRNIFINSNNIITNNNTTTSLIKTICEHYDKTEIIKNIYKNYKKHISMNFKGEIFTYNIDQVVHFMRANFNMSQSYDVIASSKNYVIYFIIKPNFSKINFSETMVDIIIKNYMLKNCQDTEQNIKFRGKQIIACVITLNSEEPIFYDIKIDDNDIDIITKIIKEYIQREYNRLNIILYDLYCYHLEDNQRRKDAIEILNEYVQTLKKNNKNYPDYILKYVENIKKKINKIKYSNDSIDIKQNKINDILKENNFIEKANKKLEKAINSCMSINKNTTDNIELIC